MSEQVRYFKCVRGCVRGTGVGDIRKVWWSEDAHLWEMEDPSDPKFPWTFDIDTKEIEGCECYFEEVTEDFQEQPTGAPKLIPRSLGCFQEVADVIGEENAEIELQKVIDDPENDIDTGGGDDLMSNFTWCDTPQGPKFWVDISNSEVPEGYQTSCHQISTSGDNNQTKDSPAFGDVLHIAGRPCLYILCDDDGDHHVVYGDGSCEYTCELHEFDEYKPDSHQEQRERILRRWQRKSLDHSHDTEVCIAEMRVSDLIDFVVDNLNAEYSKE